jgi:hypothetical protein
VKKRRLKKMNGSHQVIWKQTTTYHIGDNKHKADKEEGSDEEDQHEKEVYITRSGRTSKPPSS